MLPTRLVFNLRCLASQFFPKNNTITHCRSISSKKVKENTLAVEEEIDEEELQAREAAIEKMRDKSELFPKDYNIQHGRPPYEEIEFAHQETLRYRRRLYGKYGELSKVDPSILWPSKEELDYMKDYEGIAQPFTFQTLVERAREKRELAEKQIQDEEAKILEKVKNVNYEIVQFHKRVAFKKQKALEALEQKNRLVEKVKSHFGYNIDVRDEKFRTMFEKLQKEEKKKLKLEKKAKKQEKALGFGGDGETENKETLKESET